MERAAAVSTVNFTPILMSVDIVREKHLNLNGYTLKFRKTRHFSGFAVSAYPSPD